MTGPDRREIVTLVDEPTFRIRYATGSGDNLIVSFASIGRLRQEMLPDEFVGTALADPARHAIFVSDRRRSWMNSAFLAQCVSEAVATVVAQHRIARVTTLGLSLGGLSALIAARLFPVDTVIALSPQFSVDRRIMPDEERWAFFTRRIRRFHFPTVAPLPKTGRIFVLHGLSDDTAHMRLFPRQPNLDHFVFPKVRHSLIGRLLKESGTLAPLVAAAGNHDRVAVSGMLRRLGGEWRARFEAGDADPDTAPDLPA